MEAAGPTPYDDTLVKLREQLVEAREKSAEADAELRSMAIWQPDQPAMQQAAAEEVNADIMASSRSRASSARKRLQ